MIRQAITCDICGTEKKQTNHWFVAYEQAGELRLSEWSSRKRLRAGSKHLCGQTCLHKLADDFMARTLAVRAQPDAGQEVEAAVTEAQAPTDTSLTAATFGNDFESSARLIPPSGPAFPLPASRAQMQNRNRCIPKPLPFSRCDQQEAALLNASQTGHRNSGVAEGSLPAMPVRPLERMEGREPIPVYDELRPASKNWRAEAWERERERELRAAENRPDISARRRQG